MEEEYYSNLEQGLNNKYKQRSSFRSSNVLIKGSIALNILLVFTIFFFVKYSDETEPIYGDKGDYFFDTLGPSTYIYNENDEKVNELLYSYVIFNYDTAAINDLNTKIKNSVMNTVLTDYNIFECKSEGKYYYINRELDTKCYIDDFSNYVYDVKAVDNFYDVIVKIKSMNGEKYIGEYKIDKATGELNG